MLFRRRVSFGARTVCIALSMALGLLGCGDAEKKAKPAEPVPSEAPAAEFDPTSLKRGWEGHEWGAFQADTLRKYSATKRYSQLGRFDSHWTGEYREFVGEIFQVRFRFADSRFYQVSLLLRGASDAKFTRIEERLTMLLGRPTGRENLMEIGAVDQSGRLIDKVNGIRKIWKLGAVAVRLEREFDSKVLFLTIRHEDILMRRGRWGK